MSIMFILLSIVVYGFSVQDVKKWAGDVKYTVSRYARRLAP